MKIPSNKLFSRIGFRKDFQTAIDQATSMGARLNEDKEAGTLTVTWKDETLIRAIQKGDKDQPWIVSYNSDFFPR